MKDPYKYLVSIPAHIRHQYSLSNIIKQAQKDAYNEALEDAIENVTTKNKELNRSPEPSIVIQVVDKQSILKLKK